MTDDNKQNSQFSYVHDPKEEYEKNKNKFYKYGKIFFMFGIIACILVAIVFTMLIGMYISDAIRYY